jgi:hypothetical protein
MTGGSAGVIVADRLQGIVDLPGERLRSEFVQVAMGGARSSG